MPGQKLGRASGLNLRNRDTGHFGYCLRKLIPSGNARISKVKYATASSPSELDDGRSEVTSKGRRARFVSHDANVALIAQDSQNGPYEMFPFATV